MNEFTFHKVGQGLFYTGSILNKSFNFVYDCGTEEGEATINRSIDNYLSTLKKNDEMKPEIDFVVISHLHIDHMNGLEHLLTNAKVQRLYLPYLPWKDGQYKDASLFLLAYAIYGDNKENNQIEKKARMFKTFKWFYHLASYDNINPSENEPFYNVKAEILPNETNTKSFEYDQFWEFYLFNKKCRMDKFKQLEIELKKYPGLIKKIEDVKITSKDINDIITIYKSVFKYNDTMNATSIVLLHRPSKFSKENCSFNYVSCCTSTLLTGDACFNTKMNNILLGLIGDDGIRVLQVPHHGAKKNWNNYIKKVPARACVISYGKNNHRHPSPYVIEDIVTQGKLLTTTYTKSFKYFINFDCLICCLL